MLWTINVPIPAEALSRVKDVVMLLRRDNNDTEHRNVFMLHIIINNIRGVVMWQTVTAHVFVGKADRAAIVAAVPAAAQSVFVIFADVRHYMNIPAVSSFQSLYIHSSANLVAYERSCFERWLIYRHYWADRRVATANTTTTARKKRELILFLDADVALFAEPNAFLSAMPDSRYATRVDFLVVGLGWAVALTPSSLNAFADLIVNIYSNRSGESFASFRDAYGDTTFSPPVQQHVSDMHMQKYFGDKCMGNGTYFAIKETIVQVKSQPCFIAYSPQPLHFFNFTTTPPTYVGPERNATIPCCLVHYSGDTKKIASFLNVDPSNL